jgi:hypothetical protein
MIMIMTIITTIITTKFANIKVGEFLDSRSRARWKWNFRTLLYASSLLLLLCITRRQKENNGFRRACLCGPAVFDRFIYIMISYLLHRRRTGALHATINNIEIKINPKSFAVGGVLRLSPSIWFSTSLRTGRDYYICISRSHNNASVRHPCCSRPTTSYLHNGSVKHERADIKKTWLNETSDYDPLGQTTGGQASRASAVQGQDASLCIGPAQDWRRTLIKRARLPR